MRRVLGEDGFQTFLKSACAELQNLADHSQPWPAPLLERAIASAMFLGFDSLETACRRIAEQHPARDKDAARGHHAARTAVAALEAFRTQSRH
jgi:hypothetical protein